MCRKATATAGCCGAARATRVSWCGWFLVLWVDPSDQSKFNSNETSDERVVVAACLSLSLPWSPKRNKIPIFFHFFFFKFTARNYSAQFLSVCVVAVYLSLIKRFTLSTDHGNLSRDPSKTSCSDTRIRTIYSTNSFDISFGFLVVLGSVGSLVFSFSFCYFFFLVADLIRFELIWN